MMNIIEQNLSLFGLAFFLLVYLALELGFRGGHFIKRKGWVHKHTGTSAGFIIGGMLTLLAFLLGTALSIASEEYHERQAVVLAEANAIESAWLITGAQADDAAGDIRPLLQAYTETRISAVKNAQAPDDELRLVQRTTALRNEIWAIASDIAKRTPNDVTAELLTALTQVFESSASQRVVFDKRIPAHVAKLLVITAILTLLGVGLYLGTLQNRFLIMSTVLVLLFTGAVVLTADLSRPYEGQIRISPAPLIWMLDSMRPNP